MQRMPAPSLIVLLPVLACLTACCGSTSRPSGAALPPYIAPSDQEADVFITEVEAAMANPTPSAAAAALFDWSTLLDISLQGIDLSRNARRGLTTGFQSSVAEKGGLLTQVAREVQAGGSYRLLRRHEVDGQKRLLYRFLGADQRVNYHDLIIAKNVDGKVQAIDLYIFATGEKFSETVRRMMLAFAADQNRSVLDRLTGREQALVKNMPQLQSMSTALQNGQMQQVLDIYHKLPPELQQEKTLLLMRVTAASSLANQEELAKGVKLMEARFPGDPCLDLMSIDHYLGKGDFDAVLKALDRLDRSLGGDPYLKALRGNALSLQGNPAEGMKEVEAAVQAEPNLAETYWVGVGISLQQQDHAATLKWLKRIDQKFAPGWGDLTEQPDYANFAQSPEHEEWLSYLEQR